MALIKTRFWRKKLSSTFISGAKVRAHEVLPIKIISLESLHSVL